MDERSGTKERCARLVMQVERTALADPWLRWLHGRLAERALVHVHAIEAASGDGGGGAGRAPDAAKSPAEGRAAACLERIERRMAGDVDWPVREPLEPDSFMRPGTPDRSWAVADPPDIVLDLTAGSVMPVAWADRERWWLLVGGERVIPGDHRIGRRDVERGSPTTELLLMRSGDDSGAGRVLASAVHDTRWGGVLNRRVVLGKVPMVLAKGLERWGRGEHLTVGPDANARPRAAERRRSEPPLDRAVRLVRHEWRRRLHNVRRRLGHRPGMWSLHVGRGDPLTARLGDTVELRPAADEYWADPFLWRRGDRTFVYYEAYDYRTMRGRIAVGELLEGEPPGEESRFAVIGDVLSPAHHLSYPFLVEHAGELLMIPECSRLGRVEIHRCTRFPDRFERVATRFEGRSIVDLTLFRRDGRWWMFCAIADEDVRDTNGALHAFAVDGPMMNDIVPHTRNPIVTDSRVARPGGRVFERDGRWYRPSQDNSHGVYGHGLTLMEIRTLTLEDYEERAVRRFDANFAPGLVGVHHLDVCAERFVVDGCHALGGRPSRRARTA